MSNPDLYKCGGLLPTNGQEWKRLRTAAQPPLSKKNIEKHIPAIDKATLDFIEMIGKQFYWSASFSNFSHSGFRIRIWILE